MKKHLLFLMAASSLCFASTAFSQENSASHDNGLSSPINANAEKDLQAEAQAGSAISAPDNIVETSPENWSKMVNISAIGGHILGNPAAPTKIVEYASYTCGHCANFEVNDAPTLKLKYVASGNVSYEMRNLARDAIDLTAAVLARCGGPEKFFANHYELMSRSKIWGTNAANISEETKLQSQNRNVTGMMIGVAKDVGMFQLMQINGYSEGEIMACLTSTPSYNAVIAMTDQANYEKQINATPSFLVNEQHNKQIYDLASMIPFLPKE
ncbi:hypothetical protein LPB140_05065 [Sphingorhabdus lutea]|uniref:Thioredoxin-like fold domain-containing protein n=1 Tax=Sphingorhabdus lutea TaxID=1913578 RepID=A0A1L3JAW4_9SPHN|nr:thioredoxin domain-containing protein [Sphingorhabdus lutea]APG62277.1 hypothetical protein LPB140_05065 [Sphingorhabdus lutea]